GWTVERSGMNRLRTATILVLILAAIGGGLWWLERYTDRKIDGSVETIATASLQGLKEQARLVPFVARFVAVTTSEQARFGLRAKQTMILPGVVRYELDLNQITARDVSWDEAAKTLTVYLPPMILTGPEVDLAGMQVYDGGGILMALTDAEKTLDAANRQRGQGELLAQARGAVPMRLARDAARGAIERSFAMPLRAAGIEARVTAQFK
ncbi:MAG: DUF4230 domain-containing protein, partial [Sphingobium sp.]